MVSLSLIELDTLRHCSIFSSSSMHLSHMLSPVRENSLPPTTIMGLERALSQERENDTQPDQGVQAGNGYAETDVGHDAFRWEVELFAGHCTSPRVCLP